jgi:probable HAF family extracellular repeat protein
MSKLTKFVLMFCFVLFCPTLSHSAQIQYFVTDLGTLGDAQDTSQIYAYGLNDEGQVVGECREFTGYYHAFRTAPNSAINPETDNLGTLGWPSDCSAYGINNIGQAVGTSKTLDYPLYNGFRTAPNSAIDPATDNLGMLNNFGTELGNAYDINDIGQVVGDSLAKSDTYHAFRTAPNSAINRYTDDLGTLGGNQSCARGINNFGQVVGYADTISGSRHAFRTAPNSAINPETDDLGTFGGESSFGRGINNAGQVVGTSYISDSDYHAFLCNSTGPMQDLNNLINPSSGWTLQSANAINNKGQIAGYGINSVGRTHAYLLTPAEKCFAGQVKPPTCTPIERLRKWNGTAWVQIMPGDLSSGKVHVLVHGWGTGLKTFADDGGHVWDSIDPKTGTTNEVIQRNYDFITNSAKAIKAKLQPGDVVVAFNWLDESATTKPPSDPSCLFEAKQSEAQTQEASNQLASALYSACNFSSGYNAQIQLIGFSHGAKVAALVAKDMYQGWAPGVPTFNPIVANQLTLCDSPDNIASSLPFVRANNNLGPILKGINIGRSPGTTFVDNYCSFLGVPYGGGLVVSKDGAVFDPNIVNVQLKPTTTDFADKHGYAFNWYTGATNATNSLGLAWSPLYGDGETYKTLSSDYKQDWASGEYVLKDITKNPIINGFSIIPNTRDLAVSTLNIDGSITDLPNGKTSTEASPAYWHSSFLMNDNDRTFEFSYQWVNAGDGDQLTLWFDDEMRFVVTGNLAGTNSITTDIDISDLTVGSHILSVALNNYGAANASVNVTDFKLISYPHELVWTGLASGVWDNNVTANFTGSTSGKFIDDDIVTFDDTGSLSAIAIAPEGVNPTNVWFLNTTEKDYTLTGGPINAVNLIVAGGGEVTLGDVNCSKTILVTNGSTLTASSIVCGTLSIGGSSAATASVPEPSVLILSLLGIPFAMVFWKKIRK